MLNVLAVDCGASSVRVAVVDLDARPIAARIAHRFEHAPVRYVDGSLRWEWGRIVEEVVRGLEIGLAEGPVASIGVDTWGVDYGLLDGDGELISPPYSYRDARTEGWRDVVARVGERIGAERLYRTTGVQQMQINTIFQLAAHDRDELARARRLLMLPELLLYHLTGAAMGERTSAGTTGLVDLTSCDWSGELLDAISVDARAMPEIGRATAYAGTWRGVPVHLVGGHDTASAVAALPSPKAGAAFISSGTWMLVGREREAPDVSEAAMRANFSNEAGVFGNVRFLKNVTGLWMLDQCRVQWGAPTVEDLVDAAAALPGGGPTVDATDPRFLAPEDMELELRAAAELSASAGRDAVARCILDSLALAAARVIRELEEITGTPVPEIIIVGGGGRNGLLNRLIEEAAGVPVRVGPAEATLFGNALVQGIALERFESLGDARVAVA
jgi:rhamnulokinase